MSVGAHIDVSDRVLLIGGTSDARAIARSLGAAGFEVLVSTATGYGEELAAADGATARSGALDAGGMADLAQGCIALVDASHPFAREASESARAAAQRAGVAYVRFEREGAGAVTGAVLCESAQSAAQAAVEVAGAGGVVLLTVGSRSVATYAAACREAGVRCVARVLPVAESLAACEEAGLSPADIIGMQGPTSALLDAALLRHLGATVLVTKDSGAAGGVPQKLEAARLAGATAIVVARPADASVDPARSVDEVVRRVSEVGGSPDGVDASQASEPASPASAAATGLVHVYTGTGKGKTTASVGLAVRAAGAGLRVAFVQFVKGGPESSELSSLRKLGVAVTRPGVSSSGLMRGTVTSEDRVAADAALQAATDAFAGDYDLVVLDEACVAARKGLVDVNRLVSAVAGRAPGVEVVLTGRGAPDELLEIADYVTSMEPFKHPFERGIAARKGVEF